MLTLILGLLIFLGSHSVRMLAPGWRDGMIARFGENTWKGVLGLVSLLGLVLIVIGYGEARLSTPWLWTPPVWTRHLAALLMLPAFILLVATYLPGTLMKARLGHPMLLAVKTWALAHLLSNGSVADLLLFGSFLIWAVADYVVCRRRDRINGTTYPAAGWTRDLGAVVLGIIFWAVFAMWLHGMLIGVKPFG